MSFGTSCASCSLNGVLPFLLCSRSPQDLGLKVLGLRVTFYIGANLGPQFGLSGINFGLSEPVEHFGANLSLVEPLFETSSDLLGRHSAFGAKVTLSRPSGDSLACGRWIELGLLRRPPTGLRKPKLGPKIGRPLVWLAVKELKLRYHHGYVW